MDLKSLEILEQLREQGAIARYKCQHLRLSLKTVAVLTMQTVVGVQDQLKHMDGVVSQQPH